MFLTATALLTMMIRLIVCSTFTKYFIAVEAINFVFVLFCRAQDDGAATTTPLSIGVVYAVTTIKSMQSSFAGNQI